MWETLLDRKQCLASLTGTCRDLAEQRLQYHPFSDPDQFNFELERETDRIGCRVPGLYNSIDPAFLTQKWSIEDTSSADEGVEILSTSVYSPNGGRGRFERGYCAEAGRIELKNAFSRDASNAPEIDRWIKESPVAMHPEKGTPSLYYMTLRQLAWLGLPSGATSIPKRHPHAPAETAEPSGFARSLKMSTIQNAPTVVHLHWLIDRYGVDRMHDLIQHTFSYGYGRTVAVQCGYRAVRSYVVGDIWQSPVGEMLDNLASGQAVIQKQHQNILTLHGYTRGTVMRWNFDIEMTLAPTGGEQL